MTDEVFDGEISVKSIPDGYSVSFQGTTDAHHLGHALGAIMSTYMDIVMEVHPQSSLEDIRAMIIEGINCTLDSHDHDSVSIH